MKPIYEAWCIQILISQHCHKRCAHCSQGLRHFRKPQHMGLEQIEEGLESLRAWPKVVGCFGGEPTLHPEFEAVCKLYQKHVPRHRAGIWTSGGPKYKKYEKLIRETFQIMLYNDHFEVGKHQPVMIASDECILDEKLRKELIDACWLQKLWSPVINYKGAFFCEVAGMFDMLFDGSAGYELTPDWWRKDVSQFQDQVERYCRYCSIAVPYPVIANNLPVDYVSPKNYHRLEKIRSPWLLKGKVQVIEDTFNREQLVSLMKAYEYAPWEYLGEKEIRDKNGKTGKGYARKRDHKPLCSSG